MLDVRPEKIERKADIDGAKASAWSINLDAYRAMLGVKPDADAQLRAWVIEAPWAHPMWHSYLLSLTHLRPMPDGLPTKFYVEGASHEFVLLALDADHSRIGLIEGREPPHYLEPANFAAQMICESDDDAIAEMEKTIRLIGAGALSPDTDFLFQWIELFGDRMVRREYRQSVGETE